MLKSLKIENFRCFKEYELQQLGRINLLVGMNNNGKTAILEAIYLLYSQDDLSRLAEIMINRGEFIWRDEGDKRERELEIKHLFYGHNVEKGSYLVISNNDQTNIQQLSFKVITGDLYYEKVQLSLEKIEQEMSEKTNISTHVSVMSNQPQDSKMTITSIDYDLLELARERYSLYERKNWLLQHLQKFFFEIGINDQSEKGWSWILPLLSKDCFSSSNLENGNRNNQNPNLNLFFLTSSSLTIEKMIELFEQIVLTPEEDLVIEALQIIEPTIKRIAVFRDNFVVLLSDNNQRIPLGNMGDGIQKILGLALALVNSKDGILLVDEIDTGLHFMALSKMWKLIWETANKLNVQVFATTHNSDCWTSVTELIDPENSREDGITLHRIEKDKPHSILLTEDEIAIAAERGIEVR